eukprot:14036704-Alexandrium_andersonii.AAC.1
MEGIDSDCGCGVRGGCLGGPGGLSTAVASSRAGGGVDGGCGERGGAGGQRGVCACCRAGVGGRRARRRPRRSTAAA